MKKSLLKRILVLMMAVVLLLLCGCAAMEEGGAVLDEQLEAFMACVEAKDKDGAAELAYNQEFGEDIREFFDGLTDYWPAKAGDVHTRQSLNVTVGNRGKTYKGSYLVASNGENYVVDIAYVEDDNGAGITMLYANLSSDVAAAATPTGTLQSAAQNTPIQWCFLAIRLLFVGFVIFTVVDILRKKPRYYGLWILAALFYLVVRLRLSEMNVNFHITFGILATTEWLKYPDGLTNIVLGLPAGSIAYWCVRGSLLRQKAAKAAAEAAWYAQFQPPVQPDQAPEAVSPEVETAEREDAED